MEADANWYLKKDDEQQTEWVLDAGRAMEEIEHMGGAYVNEVRTRFICLITTGSTTFDSVIVTARSELGWVGGQILGREICPVAGS